MSLWIVIVSDDGARYLVLIAMSIQYESLATVACASAEIDICGTRERSWQLYGSRCASTSNQVYQKLHLLLSSI